MKGCEPLVRVVGQRERIAAGEDEPALKRRLQPAGQQRRQLVRRRAVLQVVLEVVEQEGDRHLRQQVLREELEPVPPGILRLAQNARELAQRGLLVFTLAQG